MHLFVYGTLRPRFASGASALLVRSARLIAEGHVRGRLFDLGDYPGLVLGGGSSSRVWGDVIALPDEDQALRAIDEYEGYVPDDPRGSLFVRTTVLVHCAEPEPLACWAYVYAQPVEGCPLIEDGRYRGSTA